VIERPIRSQVLAALRERPQTAWELSLTLGVPFHRVQPVVSNLKTDGWIVDGGGRGLSRAGGLSIRWVLCGAPVAQQELRFQ
jgi:predicted transcriptional regulator